MTDETSRQWFRIRDTLALADKLKRDPYQKGRKETDECRICFYVPSVSLQAFTQYRCETCDRSETWPNSSVPKLCALCARTNGLCRHCRTAVDVMYVDLKRARKPRKAVKGETQKATPKKIRRNEWFEEDDDCNRCMHKRSLHTGHTSGDKRCRDCECFGFETMT